jgi:actin-related protein
MELEGQISTTSDCAHHFDLNYFRENMRVEYALKDGIISNWDHLEQLWSHAAASYLKADLKETPILLSEKSYTTSTSRQK